MSEHPLQKYKKFVPVAVGLAAGAFAWFFWPHGVIWSLLALLVGYLATRVIMFPKPGSPSIRRVGPGTASSGALSEAGVTQVDLDTALRDGRAKLNILQNEAFRITKAEARRKVDAIADVVGRILDDIKQDPKDLRPARQFLDYYLDATVKIVKKYADLMTRPAPDQEVLDACIRVEGELDTIRAAFEKQLKMLTENDMLDLDVELTVLKKTIEMEGLGGPAGGSTGSTT